MYLRISLLVMALMAGTLLTPEQALWASGALLIAQLVSVTWLNRSLSWGWLVILMLALVWSSGFVTQQIHHRLPLSLHGEEVNIRGCVTGIPQTMRSELTGRRYSKFSFRLHPNQLSPAGLRQVRLNWYATGESSPAILKAGDCYRLAVVLRSPRNLANQLPFDYEAYLLFRGVDASGYVKRAQRLSYFREIPDRDVTVREALLGHVAESIPAPASVWITGLIFGDGSAFTTEQWQIVRDSGTLHLLVVSGLHVGLVAIAGYWLGWLVQRALLLFRSGRLATTVSVFPAMIAAFMATLYLYLAGAGIPLLRAWLMAMLGILMFTSARRFRPTFLLLLAAPGVLFINPLVWTQSGFWYSFAAVLALIAVFRGRKSGWIQPWLLPQLAIFFMLLPATLFWGQPVNPVQIIANALAVPLLSLLLLPLTIFCLIWPVPVLTNALAKLDQGFWWSLEYLLSLPVADIHPQGGLLFFLILLLWVTLMVLFIRGARARVVVPGSVLVLALMSRAPSAMPGVWLFDSGQGQSLLVTGEDASLLIDTGPSFSASFSIAGAVVLPWMTRAGVTDLDLLIISHSDHDHAAGSEEILNAVTVSQVLAGQPESLPGSGSCHQQGRRMMSEHLSLVFFNSGIRQPDKDNDASCVVQIHWYDQRILVPGDITAEAERRLVLRYGEQLRSEVLVAGHHGSNTSSSAAWLKAVAPQQVWISAGYRNRFGHPHKAVLQRIKESDAEVLVTADSGLIRLYPDGSHTTARSGWQPPWRQ